MIINKLIFLFALIFLITACSKKTDNESLIKEKSLELQVLEAYKEGKESLEKGDVLFAAKKFNEAEILLMYINLIYWIFTIQELFVCMKILKN